MASSQNLVFAPGVSIQINTVLKDIVQYFPVPLAYFYWETENYQNTCIPIVKVNKLHIYLKCLAWISIHFLLNVPNMNGYISLICTCIVFFFKLYFDLCHVWSQNEKLEFPLFVWYSSIFHFVIPVINLVQSLNSLYIFYSNEYFQSFYMCCYCISLSHGGTMHGTGVIMSKHTLSLAHVFTLLSAGLITEHWQRSYTYWPGVLQDAGRVQEGWRCRQEGQ